MIEATKNFNISMIRGDTLSFAFEVAGVESLDTAYFSCKINSDDIDYIFQKSFNSGITPVIDGKYRVRVAPSDTEDIEVGYYYYDLQIGANGDIFTILRGILKVEQNITGDN